MNVRGVDERPVVAVRIRKSIGCERTLERDISVHSSVIIELYHVAVELIERLQRKEFKGNTLTLKIKFHDFSQITLKYYADAGAVYIRPHPSTR